METLDSILLRRSIRKYTQEPISDEAIHTILQSALSAPSGLNLQPWYFVVLKSPEKRKELFRIMEKVSDDISSELESRFEGHPEIIDETKKFIRTLGDAPAILLAFLLRDDYADPKTATLSVAAAVENALLAARDLGIGSCWLSAADQTGFGPVIRDHFAPGKGDLIAIVTLGYPEAWPKAVIRRENRTLLL